MILTEEQTEYINTSLKFYGVASDELRADLLDHICTFIEQGNFVDFETAYVAALQKFGGYNGVINLQRETYVQVTVRRILRLKIVLYASLVIACILTGTGFLFKLFHWQGAMVMLFLGIALLLVLVLPLYFYQRFRITEYKLSNQ